MYNLFIEWNTRPPTNNQLYTNIYQKGRAISPKYRAWSSNNIPMITNTKKFEMITEPFQINYDIMKPNDKRKRDLANYEKALTDSLVKHKIIKDDCLIERLVMQWFIETENENRNEVLAWIKLI